MPKLLTLSGLFLFFSWVSAFGQWRAPKYSNEFLSIGVGAEALAMSGAVSAGVSDLTSAYWNPAGLAHQTRKNELALMHASYFAGIANYDYGGFSHRVDSNGTLAISFIRFAVDDIPDTRFLIDNGQIDYRRIRSFSSSDNALFFSYAQKNVGIKNLSLGGSLKIIYRNAGKFANAWGFGLDAGAQYRKGDWLFGLMARDVTSTFNAWSYNASELEPTFSQTNNVIPVNSVEITLPSLNLGITRSLFFLQKKINVQPSLEMASFYDGKRNMLIRSNAVSIDPRLGLNSQFFNFFSVRAGLGGWQQIKNFEGGSDWTYQVTFGLGLRWRALHLDYAITDLGDQAEALYSHIFSLKASF